jgi:hypothetical protein
VRGVAERGAVDGGDARQFRAVLAGQRPCALQPGQRAFIAAAQELDVTEFAARGGGQHRRYVVADLQRLVKRGGAFLVAPARGMHQRAAQGHAGARAQRRVAGGVGLGDGAAQALQAGIERAGADRRFPGFELRQRGGAPGGGPRGGRRGERAQGGVQRGAGLHAEFALEQFTAGGGLARRTDAVARGREAAHQQRLVVFVQRVVPNQPAGQRGGFGHGARGHAGLRGFAQHGFGGGLEVAALRGKPDLEGRAAGKIHALQQLAVQAGHAQGLRPAARQHGA